MSNDTVLFLALSQNTSHSVASKDEERIQQYINGIEKLFEYDFKDRADVIVCDNTTEHLDKRIIKALPCDTEYYTYENNLGAQSKSVGLYHQWKHCIDAISKYEWVVHFEPRQLLKNHLFFDSYFNNKQNLVNFRGNLGAIWTGLFSIKTNLLSKFLKESPVTGAESIEYILFRFIKQYECQHEELNVLWNEVANNRWIDI